MGGTEQNHGSGGDPPKETVEDTEEKLKKLKKTISSTELKAQRILELAKRKSSRPPPPEDQEKK